MKRLNKTTKKLYMISIIVVFLLSMTIIFVMNSKSLALYKNNDYDVEAKEKPLIGVVLKAMDSDHWKKIKKGVLDAAEEYEVDVIVLAPDKESNVNMQFQMIRDLVDMEVDAICVAPSDSKEILPLFKEINDKGIKIFTVGTNANNMKYIMSFVGTDNYKAGVMAGEMMKDSLKGQGNVVIVSGELSQQTHIDRVGGFKEIINKTDIHIIEVIQASSDLSMAYDLVNTLINEGGRPDGIFITNGLMTLGVIKGIDNCDVVEKMEIIGMDNQKELMFALENADVDGVISQSPYDMGYEVIRIAKEALDGKMTDEWIETQSVMITKENLETYKFLFEE